MGYSTLSSLVEFSRIFLKAQTRKLLFVESEESVVILKILKPLSVEILVQL